MTSADTFPVENPAVRRIAATLGLTVTTDQAGKDGAETDTGIVIESRYFVGDVLVTREHGTDALGFGSREWHVGGLVFGGPTQAFEHVARGQVCNRIAPGLREPESEFICRRPAGHAGSHSEDHNVTRMRQL